MTQVDNVLKGILEPADVDTSKVIFTDECEKYLEQYRAEIVAANIGMDYSTYPNPESFVIDHQSLAKAVEILNAILALSASNKQNLTGE